MSIHGKHGERTPQSNLFGTELLGNQFLITIPCSYRICPHYGVDYENYSLVPYDTLVNDPGTAGIIVGNNVGAIGAFIEKRNRKDTLASTISGRNVDWIVYDLDTVLFAECFVEGDFCAAIESKSRNEIHQFIKVLESLREK